MLDEENGDAVVADPTDEFAEGDPLGGFIPAAGSSSARSFGSVASARNLKPALVAVREAARVVRSRPDPDVVESSSARRSICFSSSKVPRVRSTAPTTPARVRACRPIITFFERREVDEKPDVLEGAADAGCTWCAFRPLSGRPSKVNSPSSGS